MPVGLGPRFALEAGFLILLAVVVGLADLRPALIVLVMAIAWLLVSLIEYLAWRQGPRLPALRSFSPMVQPAPIGVEAETAIEPAPAAAQPAETSLEAEPSEAADPPRPRRRWLIFGARARESEQGESGGIEPPRHVRRVPPSSDEAGAPAEGSHEEER